MDKTLGLNLIDSSLNDIHKDIFLRKDYIDKLRKYADTKQIIVVQGQRRCGKSHIILGLLKSMDIPMKKIFYINKEKDENRILRDTNDLSDLFNLFCIERGEPERIVIDEVQDIKNREIFIRSKYSDKKYHIILSGSNAHLLNGEFATYLSGRYISMFVYPFGYDEFINITKEKKIEISNATLFENYIHYGGMPESILINNKDIQRDYVRSIINTVVVKDILERNETKVRSVNLLLQILEYLADITGSIISMKSIADSIGNHNNEKISSITIGNYIKYLQDAYIIHEVKRYNILGKMIFQNKNKYYFNDLGIRNAWKYNFVLDRGKLLENLVFLHLNRLGYEVFVGELGEKEIDFIAKKGEKIQYIQVAWSINSEKVMEREFGNLLSIKDGYPKHVVSFDGLGQTIYEGILYRNIETFLKEFE